MSTSEHDRENRRVYAARAGDDARRQRYLDEAREHEIGLSRELLENSYGDDSAWLDASTAEELRMAG